MNNNRRLWLKEIRMKKGFTLRELAKHVSCSFTYLCDIERGRRRPGGKLAYELSTVLGFDMQRFYNEVDDVERVAQHG